MSDSTFDRRTAVSDPPKDGCHCFDCVHCTYNSSVSIDSAPDTISNIQDMPRKIATRVVQNFDRVLTDFPKDGCHRSDRVHCTCNSNLSDLPSGLQDLQRAIDDLESEIAARLYQGIKRAVTTSLYNGVIGVKRFLNSIWQSYSSPPPPPGTRSKDESRLIMAKAIKDMNESFEKQQKRLANILNDLASIRLDFEKLMLKSDGTHK